MTAATAAQRYGIETIEQPQPDDLTLLSVTSIIDVISKGGLVWWAANEVAKLAVHTTERWLPLADGDPAGAVAHLAKAHDREAEHAKEVGRKVHDALEDYALTGVRPEALPEAEPFIEQFDRWLTVAQPRYEAAEMTVFNPTYGYAGTLDAIAVIGGVRFLVDYKTAQKPYTKQGRPTKPYADSAGLQLAAYAFAERAAVARARRVERPFYPRHYAVSPDELAQAVPMPEVDAGLVVHITTEHCAAYPFRLDGEAFRAFLHALETYRWVKDTSKSVMGPPLVFGGQ